MFAAEIIEWASYIHIFGKLMQKINLYTSGIPIEENELLEKLFRCRLHALEMHPFSDSRAAHCTLYFLFCYIFFFVRVEPHVQQLIERPIAAPVLCLGFISFRISSCGYFSTHSSTYLKCCFIAGTRPHLVFSINSVCYSQMTVNEVNRRYTRINNYGYTMGDEIGRGQSSHKHCCFCCT